MLERSRTGRYSAPRRLRSENGSSTSPRWRVPRRNGLLRMSHSSSQLTNPPASAAAKAARAAATTTARERARFLRDTRGDDNGSATMAGPMDPARRADLVVTGRVLTLDPARPRAGAVAAAGGVVIATGSAAEMRALAGPGAAVVDAGEGTVLPGFRDAHLHLLALGRQASRLDLHGTDLAALRAAVAARAATLPPGAWIEGAGWSADSLGRTPDAADLAGCTGGRPALLLSHDFHSALVSVEAMAILGMLPGAECLLPGEIARDGGGAPTGLLREAQVFAAAGAASAQAAE